MCSAAAMVLPVGALTTVIPARVAASRSTLSTPTPARPMTTRRVPAAISSASTWTWLRTIERVVVGQDRAQLVAGEAGPLVDLVVGAQELDALARRPVRRRGSSRAGSGAARRGEPVGLDGGGLGGGDRRTRAGPVGPDASETNSSVLMRAEDLLERDRPEVAEPEDLAGQLALAAGEDDAAPLDLAVERLPVEAVGDAAPR